MFGNFFKKPKLPGQGTDHPEPRLLLKPPAGWRDEGFRVNQRGGPTYRKNGGSSEVQISIERRYPTYRMESSKPVWWLTQLARSTAFGCYDEQEIGYGGGACDFGFYGFVELTASPDGTLELYYLSDGSELILATLIGPPNASDQVEARQLILSCSLITPTEPVPRGRPSVFDLILEEKFEEACQAYAENCQGFERSNWALALLNLGRFQDASRLYQGLSEEAGGQIASFLAADGVCQWGLGNRAAAIHSWAAASALPLQVTGDGVETAAFLYYGAARCGDANCLELAKSRLRRFSQEGTSWPFSIAGYLLEEMDSCELLLEPSRQVPGLHERQMCQAYFWIGFLLSLQGNRDAAMDYYRKSLELKGASFLELERYLAVFELSGPSVC